MKILVIGAGAVGGYFGGRLAMGGNAVTFLSRGKRLQALREEGLKVESIKGNFSLNPVIVTDKPQGVFDLILVAVKGYDLSGAITIIEKMSSDTNVISLLNGIESEEALIKSLGSERVIGGVAFIGSSLLENGVISHTAAGSLTIGELWGGVSGSARCGEIERAFSDSGVRCRVSENIQGDIWSKMLWNTGFNAVTAITGAYVSEVLQSNETESLIVEAMEEARRVAAAENINLPEDIIINTLEKSRGAGAIKSSMLQDLERGARTEVGYLNGAIIRLGDKHGIPVPVNRTLLRLVSFKEKKRFNQPKIIEKSHRELLSDEAMMT